MSKMPESAVKCNVSAIDGIVEEIRSYVSWASDAGLAAHDFEADLWRQLLMLGHALQQRFFALQGDGDRGETLESGDGRCWRRLSQPHRREYRSVFGEFELERYVYGTREGQTIEAVPYDARLRLPARKNSYLLQDCNQALCSEMAFRPSSETMERILRMSQSVHSLQRNGRELAAHTESFWGTLPVPASAEEGELLVVSADGKGIPMRQERQALGIDRHRSESGARAGSKKMALLGAVYSIDPYRRDPQSVFQAMVNGSASVTEPPRPEPKFKRVRGAILRDADDRTDPQVHSIFSWLAAEATARGIETQRPVILLMDGQQSQWNAGASYLPDGENYCIIEILDILHVLVYLWQAVHLFFPSGSIEAHRLLQRQLRRVLAGDVAKVIRTLSTQASRRGLAWKRREELKTICGYFRNNAHRMRYSEYLVAGYPIASGVIEGACRYVVKDRMERSGMRWQMPGAQAMLSLRCIRLSGLWAEFLQHAIRVEIHENYGEQAANDPDYDPRQVA